MCKIGGPRANLELFFKKNRGLDGISAKENGLRVELE
jgi:hypothetical protein